MSIKARIEYLKAIYLRYKNSSRSEKTKILDEFTINCKYNRKYAIRRINEFPKELKKKPGPKCKYTEDTIHHLKKLWIAMEQLCSKKMVVALPLWLPFYEEKVSEETKKQLLKISPSTIDRLLKQFKKIYMRRRRAGTRPGSLIKNKIPIQITDWNISKPGFLEADTVAHCGNSLVGSFVWTLTYTDIFSAWTENRAIWCKGAEEVVTQTDDVIKSVPFDVLGFDCDNGSEFLNYHLLRYFESTAVKFTRSRPYHKQDNAYVEQKNWTHVRLLMGYDRLEMYELIPLINDLYKSSWNPYFNFFIPTLKLLTKTRVGSKIKKTYDKSRTPYQRLLDSPDISSDRKEKLTLFYKTLNPFKLRQQVDQKLKIIFDTLKTKSHPLEDVALKSLKK